MTKNTASVLGTFLERINGPKKLEFLLVAGLSSLA
jgi:hypothetical protein